MTYLDFHARAELYLGSDWHTASAQGPRRFGTVAQALHFAFEEAAPVSLRGARLVAGDLSFSGDDLAGLYRSADYPLPRKGELPKGRSRRQLNPAKGASHDHRLRRPSRTLRRQALRQERVGPVQAVQLGL